MTSVLLYSRTSVGGGPRYLDLLRRPLVQVDRLDSGYVDPQVAVDSSTADADEDAQVP